MPPKAEIRKNPFAPKISTTVKRERDEVYPKRKGLNQPEFLGDSPLDLLFQHLEAAFDEKLDQMTVELVAQKLSISSENLTAFELRYKLTETLLDLLGQIEQYSVQAKLKSDQKDLISISLHDIKTFAKLVNLIIILLIYPAIMAFKVGVPLEKRRLNDFGTPLYKPLRSTPIPPLEGASTTVDAYANHSRLLSLVYRRLFLIFKGESDVKDLLLKGSGYSDFLVVAILLCTSPAIDPVLQTRAQAEYDTVCSFASTYELYQDYSLLVSTPSAPYFKSFVMEKLQLLPYNAPKGDGVLTLIEFVLGLRDSDEVNMEKFDHVASVLLLKPKSLSSPQYFSSIGSQCYELLININRPTVTACIGYCLEKLWLKNRLIVADFFLKRLWSCFLPQLDPQKLILVSEKDLNNAVNVMVSLTSRAFPVDMIQAFLSPILLSIWDYFCFLSLKEKPTDVVLRILVSYFTYLGNKQLISSDELNRISMNLVPEHEFKFRVGPNGLVEVVDSREDSLSKLSSEQKVMHFLKALDINCKNFIEVLKQLDDSLIQKVFINLMSRWAQDQKGFDDTKNPFLKLIDMRLLDSVGNEFLEKLAQTPIEILRLVEKILHLHFDHTAAVKPEADSDDEDASEEPQNEVTKVVLELLSNIITQIQPSDLTSECHEVLASIKSTLHSRHQGSEVARNVESKISQIVTLGIAQKSESEKDQRLLDRALANLNDPQIPARAHGLYLLRQLIEAGSPAVPVKYAVKIHADQLLDAEPFVYLNVIKGLESLLQFRPTEVLPILINIYTGKDQSAAPLSKTSDSLIDQRLRIGEVLLRFIQAQGEAYSGLAAQIICSAALSMVRRSGNDSKEVDDRLRMSAMSILGASFNTNALGVVDFLTDGLDCAVGILDLETEKDQAVMRRAAIVLIHDLVLGTSKFDSVPFPRTYVERVLTKLRYVSENDFDLLVKDQAKSVLDLVDELSRAALESDEI